MGEWIRKNTLSDSEFLTIGPSLANIIQFYGKRRALALSVSPNPLHRNPTYQPVLNADLMLRTNAVQYLVYDSYSAARTPFFARRLMAFVHKYNGILVCRELRHERGPLQNRLRQRPGILDPELIDRLTTWGQALRNLVRRSSCGKIQMIRRDEAQSLAGRNVLHASVPQDAPQGP